MRGCRASARGVTLTRSASWDGADRSAAARNVPYVALSLLLEVDSEVAAAAATAAARSCVMTSRQLLAIAVINAMTSSSVIGQCRTSYTVTACRRPRPTVV